MKIRMQLAAALAAFALTAGYAYAQSSPNLSHAELKKMVKSAKTADDYASLASYYRWRQEELKEQACAELAKWDWRSLYTTYHAEKYPNPMDASRNYAQYLNYEAQQMSRKSAYYQNLAESAQR